MGKDNKVSRFKALLALTAVLYVAAKASGRNNTGHSQGNSDVHDDDEFEPETISINYDLAEFLYIDTDLGERVTFERIVFKLQSLMYKGMGADFMETVKEEFEGLKPGEKYDDKEKIDYLQDIIEHYATEFKKEIKYSKTKHTVVLDDPARISNELRELKFIIKYIEEFIKETEHIVNQENMDPVVKKVVLTSYSLFRSVLRFIIHLEVSLAKKLKRSGNEVDAKKIERVMDELEKRGK